MEKEISKFTITKIMEDDTVTTQLKGDGMLLSDALGLLLDRIIKNAARDMIEDIKNQPDNGG